MPNTPATVLCGASAFARGSTACPEDAIIVSRLFSSIGFCIEVSSEAELDAVTGLSGSGPAYVSTCSALCIYLSLNTVAVHSEHRHGTNRKYMLDVCMLYYFLCNVHNMRK